ncbi:endospore germination permease [Ornithinibacillus sp. FSL M8-0202]|uniref:GerAB/ArcD/ProY family transporter n=1 Tax=Ornithinibacillus sp. FSL M8-0202 TaxID=2921616 RepID=UPI0030D42279
MTEKLDGKQYAVLVIMNTLGASIIFIPSIATIYGKENGWITLVLSIIVGSVIILLYNQVIKVLDGKAFFPAIESLLGKWFGTIMILLFTGFVFVNSSANLWSISDFVSLQILMGTPFEAISFMIIITTLIAIKYGIEVIGRTAELFFPFTMISAILLTLLVLKDADITNIQPIFQLNRTATIVGIIPILSITFLELVILIGISSFVNQQKSARKALLAGGITSGLILLIVTFACITVLGVGGTIHYTYPIYALGQRISIFHFFERVEILVAFIWFFTIFIKLCVSFYVLANGISHLFKMKHYKALSVPLAFLLFLGSMLLVRNTLEAHTFINGSYSVLSITIGFLFPIIILLVHYIKKV